MGLFKVKFKTDIVTSKEKHLLLEGDEVVLRDVTEHIGNLGSTYSSKYFEVYSLSSRKYLGNINNLEVEDIEVIEDVKKMYCAFQGENNYLDDVGEIIDEGKDYYVINVAKGYYGGGQELWSVKKEEVKLFDSPELASEWIKDQDYYYDDDYPYGLPPGIERPSR